VYCRKEWGEAFSSIFTTDTGIDVVKKQRNAEYAKHINDPVLSTLKMEGIRLLF
jgi:hypothetical protein